MPYLDVADRLAGFPPIFWLLLGASPRTGAVQGGGPGQAVAAGHNSRRGGGGVSMSKHIQVSPNQPRQCHHMTDIASRAERQMMGGGSPVPA
jgi:hypothetical protein